MAKDYSLYMKFIRENLPNGFLKVNTESPTYRKLEAQCRELSQTFHCADVLQVDHLFVEKGLGPFIGLPYGTGAPEISPESFFNAAHPEHEQWYRRGLTKLISLGYSLVGQQGGYILYFRIFRLRDIHGDYNEVLFQSYSFSAGGDWRKVYTLIVLTNVNHIYNPRSGIYCYLGTDLLQFRPPDAELLKPSYNLSNRERIILDLISKDKTSSEIADILFLSKHTIDTHRRNILLKTGSKTTTALISDLVGKGII